MLDKLMSIPNIDVYIVLGIIILFIFIEIAAGYLKRTQRTKADWMHEVGGFLILSIFIKTGIVLAAMGVGYLLAPSLSGVFSAKSLLFTTCFYLFIDDVMQYWYHRSAHEYEFLWKLHRPHHQAEEMGFFVAYRNAAFYYVLMPNLWWGGICTFFGGGLGVALGLILKQIIIVTSHSTVKYDSFLYKHKIFAPFIRVWERIFITPAFHHRHHGKTQLDEGSDPNGNFGNMFSIWDQLFGTASFVHAYPKEYGLVNDPKESWASQYLFPFVASGDRQSEISRGFVKEDTRTPDSITVDLVKDHVYLYCQCGKSKNAPFCDGMHHGTKYKPMRFTAKRNGKAKLCNCKMTNTGPFCDNSHLQWDQSS